MYDRLNPELPEVVIEVFEHQVIPFICAELPERNLFLAFVMGAAGRGKLPDELLQSRLLPFEIAAVGDYKGGCCRKALFIGHFVHHAFPEEQAQHPFHEEVGPIVAESQGLFVRNTAMCQHLVDLHFTPQCLCIGPQLVNPCEELLMGFGQEDIWV